MNTLKIRTLIVGPMVGRMNVNHGRSLANRANFCLYMYITVIYIND